MFLGALERWTAEHRSELEARGVEVRLSERNATDKPAQRLTLSTQDREAELIVWVSGECETAIGRPDSSVTPEQIHYALVRTQSWLWFWTGS
jgi:hypothetical protein